MSKLDETDMKILSALYSDASISVPQLSKQLGVNLSVTYSRIKRLQKRGIIERFTILVSEEKLGLTASAMAGINIDPKQREAVISEIEKLDSIRLLREITGRFDIWVNLRGQTLDELHKTVYDTIGKLPGVIHVEIFMEVSRKIPPVRFRIAD
ncbi:MAG: Lrp/AsnC family transcriptional regulator [Nitrososphaerales archaeon]|nr:Lrp/AsnC family transcriptional regulator [Nitrososphaerales archaeon]